MLGLVVLIVAIVALRHPTSKSTGANTTSAPTTSASRTPSSPGRSSSAPRSGSSSKASSKTSTSKAPSSADAKALPLVVLNDTTVPHLASDASDLFVSAGWNVTSHGNYANNTVISTCAYYDPSVAGAETAANLLKTEFPAILRVKPKFDGLPAGPIVVVLTSNFTTA